MRRMLCALESWAMDDRSMLLGLLKVMLVIVALIGVIALVVAIVISLLGGESAESRCLDSGRGWAVSGSHTELVYNAALKMATPQTVTDYACYEVSR